MQGIEASRSGTLAAQTRARDLAATHLVTAWPRRAAWAIAAALLLAFAFSVMLPASVGVIRVAWVRVESEGNVAAHVAARLPLAALLLTLHCPSLVHPR